MNYRLINLQKASLVAAMHFPKEHPVRVKLSAEIARERAGNEEPYLRSLKLNPAPKK